MTERTNEQWLADSRTPDQGTAVADLTLRLARGLGAVLGQSDNVSSADIDDFAQEALLKILNALESFRGESRFTTWAQKIAVRVAFTELRRRRWRDWSLDEMVENTDAQPTDFTPAFLTDPAASPDQQAVQRSLLDAVSTAINQELTERQRTALVALHIHGVPLEEVARHLGTNRNALYKTMHDARRKLKQALLQEGLTPDEILGAFR